MEITRHLNKQTVNKSLSDDLDNEFADSWNTTESNEVIEHKQLSNLEVLLKSNKAPRDTSNNVNIDITDKIDLLKKQGVEMLVDFKQRGIEVSGIDESMIIKEWDDLQYLNYNDNHRYVSDIIKSIKNYGFESPRPIQCVTIGRIAKGGDMITQAKAGNGKTAAFVIGSALHIDPTIYKTQVLILSPTQLLTDQIMEVVNKLTSQTGITVHCYRGGLPQPRDGKIPHIIVGCPGRIIDLIKRRRINLSQIKSVILDEGDELLKQGFREQIKNIIETLVENVQICLFSATLPKGILELCTRFMRDPAYVILPENQVITELVTQWYVKCSTLQDKDECVIDAITSNPTDTIIVFFNSCTRLQKFSKIISEIPIPIQHICIHSKMESNERVKSISDFLAGNCRVLLASDIASRGLDIPCVTLVINYDIPCSVETYVHRIGRSGRGDRLGNSITLLISDEERKKITFIVQVHGIPIRALKTIKMESKPNANPLSVAHH